MNNNVEVAEKPNGNADHLKGSLIKFFTKKENVERLLPIVKRTSQVSLRLLDYFCVNYARSSQCSYPVNGDRGPATFNVYASYKYQLKQYSKKLFDPFRRNDKFTMRYGKEHIDTTLGQLCFFQWCLQHNVLDYVEQHLSAISDDMKKNGKMDGLDLCTPETKRRSSRKKSSLGFTATRIPAKPGTDAIVVSFD